MKYTIDGEVLEIDSGQMKYGEMHDASRALEVQLSDTDFMAIHGVNLWVAWRRKHPELSPVQVTDWVRALPFEALASAQDDDPSPLGDGENGNPVTTRPDSGTQDLATSST